MNDSSRVYNCGISPQLTGRIGHSPIGGYQVSTSKINSYSSCLYRNFKLMSEGNTAKHDQDVGHYSFPGLIVKQGQIKMYPINGWRIQVTFSTYVRLGRQLRTPGLAHQLQKREFASMSVTRIVQRSPKNIKQRMTTPYTLTSAALPAFFELLK